MSALGPSGFGILEAPGEKEAWRQRWQIEGVLDASKGLKRKDDGHVEEPSELS